MARWEVLHAGEMSLVWRSMWTHRKGAVGGGGGVLCRHNDKYSGWV